MLPRFSSEPGPLKNSNKNLMKVFKWPCISVIELVLKSVVDGAYRIIREHLPFRTAVRSCNHWATRLGTLHSGSFKDTYMHLQCSCYEQPNRARRKMPWKSLDPIQSEVVKPFYFPAGLHCSSLSFYRLKNDDAQRNQAKLQRYHRPQYTIKQTSALIESSKIACIGKIKETFFDSKHPARRLTSYIYEFKIQKKKKKQAHVYVSCCKHKLQGLGIKRVVYHHELINYVHIVEIEKYPMTFIHINVDDDDDFTYRLNVDEGG